MRIRFSVYFLSVLLYFGSVAGYYFLFLNYSLSLPYYLLINTVYSAIFSLVWYYVFVDKIVARSMYLFLFSFTLISFLPLLGNSLIIVITPWLTLVKKARSGPKLQLIEHPVYQYEGDVKTDIDIGSMWGQKINLNSERTSTGEKMRALTVLNAVFTPGSMYINAQTLKHRDDEVRLYAFALLNSREKEIERRIGVSLKQLKASEDATRKALLEKELASLYWELIYYHFISSDLLDFTLSKALEYVLSSVKILSNDVSLWLLMGRLYSKKGNFDEAVRAFERAIELKVPVYRVAPYLAEIYFKKKDYAKVRKYLNDDIALQQVMGLQGCIHFWRLKPSENNLNRGEDAKRDN